MRRLLDMIALACVALSFATAPALTAPADDATAVLDHWAKAYNDHDAAALINLYAGDAVLFGTAEPMIFDGSKPASAHYSGLAGSDNTVRICDRHALSLREDAVLLTGSYQFQVGQDGIRALMPGRFSMLIVKHDGNWQISYHTSSHGQPVEAGKGARQASVAPVIPAECR